jgi:hypothetical protein
MGDIYTIERAAMCQTQGYDICWQSDGQPRACLPEGTLWKHAPKDQREYQTACLTPLGSKYYLWDGYDPLKHHGNDWVVGKNPFTGRQKDVRTVANYRVGRGGRRPCDDEAIWHAGVVREEWGNADGLAMVCRGDTSKKARSVVGCIGRSEYTDAKGCPILSGC